MTKGQQAMAHAMIYPEAVNTGRRGENGSETPQLPLRRAVSVMGGDLRRRQHHERSVIRRLVIQVWNLTEDTTENRA